MSTEAPGATPTQPETTIFTPGVAGLWLTTDTDALPPDAAVVYDNWRVVDRTRVQIRPGYAQVLVFPGGSRVHSLNRIYQPATGDFVGIIGVDGSMWRGTPLGGFAVVSTGLSGNPVTLLPYRPALSGVPWMLGADSVAMGQIPPTGEGVFLGLPAPVAVPTTAIADILTTGICSFEGITAAANWTCTQGVSRDTPALAGAPAVAQDVPGLQGSCVEFVTVVPSSIMKGYSSILGIASVMDLTQLQGGFAPASSEDIIHLWLRLDRPGLVEEVKVFFVCASGFSPGIVPGQDGTVNQDAFVKTFAPSEFTGFLEGLQSASTVADIVQGQVSTEDYLQYPPHQRSPEVEDHLGPLPSRPEDEAAGSTPDPSTSLPETFAPGRNTWTEFGVIGRPLRRNDFTRIGSTAGRGWDTITGIIIVIQTSTNQVVRVACDDWYLTGGYGLDASEPGAQTYDYRYTHYHLDTGDESNPSPIQEESARKTPMRQRIRVTPGESYTSLGAARVRQRFYRRGGLLVDDWYYLGRNTSNGGAFLDPETDLAVSAAPTLEIDNYQPVPTIDSTGTQVLNQPIPAIWGPVDGAIYGCGDPKRPGVVYRSKTGRPGSWPPDLATEVCSPSEELMHGFSYGGQAFVASRRRIFALGTAANGQIVAQDTLCLKGFAGRWAYCVGPQGCAFVADDGIYGFTGTGTPTLLSAALAPLWRGETVQGLSPIDLSAEAYLRLFVERQWLYFLYRDTLGATGTFVLDLLLGVWSRYTLATPMASFYWDAENPELPAFWGGATTGIAYGQGGIHDAGTPIVGRYQSPSLTCGRPREEKQVGDVTVRAGYVPAGAVSVQLIADTTALTAVTLPAGAATADVRTTVDVADATTRDVRARTFVCAVTWTQPLTALAPGELRQVLLTTYPLGEETYKRVGQWEPLGNTGGFLTGCVITADLREAGQLRSVASPVTRTVLIEYSRNGVLGQLGPFTIGPAIPSAPRQVQHLAWIGVRADQVRLVPTDTNPWILFKLDWQTQAEPGTATTFDSNEEVKGDTYYTGLNLTVRAAAALTVTGYIDGVALPPQGVPSTPNGKTIVHLTYPPGYGHVYRFTITSAEPFSVYGWDWQLVDVPSEQTNWNRPFEVGGTLTDKWIKGVLLECDTGGLTKTVVLQVDGASVQSFPVLAAGRSIVHVSFPQVRGRVLRLLPSDTVPSRLWTVQWIFDEEPLALQRWETQLLDHGQSSWHSVFDLDVEYRAPSGVQLTVEGYAGGELLFRDEYYLLATLEKAKYNQSLIARRATHWKYLFQSSVAFYLYREGCRVNVLPWDGSPGTVLQPFGNDDLDHGRAMGNAALTAATPNRGGRQ